MNLEKSLNNYLGGETLRIQDKVFKEKLDEFALKEQINLQQCPFCGKKAFEIENISTIELFYCECKNEFHRHNYHNVLKTQKIKKSSVEELIQMVDDDLERVNKEFRERGKNMNEKLDLWIIIHILHERLKRLEKRA